MTQKCPNCGAEIGIMPGTPEAICQNCGFKDPCCELYQISLWALLDWVS